MIRFERWPTGNKLLLILTAALLPLGLALAWMARDSLAQAGRANRYAAEQQARAAAAEIESLIARDAFGLGIAASGAFQAKASDPCAFTASALALTPAIANRFVLRDQMGNILCNHGGMTPSTRPDAVAPGDIRLWVSQTPKTVYYRTGVTGGMATGYFSPDALAAAVRSVSPGMRKFVISDGENQLVVIDSTRGESARRLVVVNERIARSQLKISATIAAEETLLFDRIAILLPLLMWFVATLLSWLLVRRMLIQPLARLQSAVTDYHPGEGRLELPERLGPATEIRELAYAFERAVEQIDQSERQMGEALEGQRRLVREVHHRVKNNLQVVASLLNIHRRSATTPEAGAAYAAIGRRVDALSVVHRNHFAEVEESRGIALRPLLVELAGTLRGSAPEQAQGLRIQLDVDPLYTTQDAAVAAAFFVTEVVEYSMLTRPASPIDIELRRANELVANLTISSEALMAEKDGAAGSDRDQFSRVVGGLARQLRSPLDERMGRIGVDIPVFPDA